MLRLLPQDILVLTQSLYAFSQRGRSNHRNTQNLQWTSIRAFVYMEMEEMKIIWSDCQAEKTFLDFKAKSTAQKNYAASEN